MIYSLSYLIIYFSCFVLHSDFVQFLQYYYQSGCLYRLRALGERHNMDLTVGGLCVLFSSLFSYSIADLSANTCFHMCFMIRGVSVLDVEGSDLSTAFPFFGPCKFDTVFVNLGLFCNKCNHLAWTANFLFCGNVITVVKICGTECQFITIMLLLFTSTSQKNTLLNTDMKC